MTKGELKAVKTIWAPTPVSFEKRIEQPDANEFINLIVGEVDRLQKYPNRGFMDKIDIPDDVLAAQQFLVGAGYIAHLVPGD